MTSLPISIVRTTTPKTKPDQRNLVFGKTFTDHMFIADWDPERQWHGARIIPYQPFSIDPAASGLHYGQAVFEGVKAFRGTDGTVRLFRPDQNAERLQRSCARLCMPAPDKDLILRSFHELIRVDQDWAPSTRGTSLYIRPFCFANEALLGVRPAQQYIYCVILSPVGPYYPEGMKPVRILVADDQVRAVEGGIGDIKAAGNYAASLFCGEKAKAQGYIQVLWLDGKHRQYLNEVGAMNIMLKIGDEIITPPLDGSILPGVTRASVLTLLRDWGLKVSERPITINDVLAAAKNGALEEMWGTGTAAVVSPVGELGYKGENFVIHGGEIGPLTKRLYEAITAIQYGETNDRFGWTAPL